MGTASTRAGPLAGIRKRGDGRGPGRLEALRAILTALFCILGYSRPLIVRDPVMNELVTKVDLALALENFESEMTIRVGSMIAAGIVTLVILQCIL